MDFSAGRTEVPREQLEEAVSRVWCDVFQRDHIDHAENFFGLGGDSLLAMRLMEELAARLHIQLPVVTLFRNPTIRDLTDAAIEDAAN